MTEPEPALRELARVYGVMTSFEERPHGPVRHASAEALLGVLRALGAPVAHPSDVRAAVRERRAELDDRWIEPVVVVWGSVAEARAARGSVAEARAARVPVRLRSEDGAALECALTLESGETREWRASPSGAARAPRLEIPGPIPIGYHRLTLRAGQREASSWLFCAPVRTWQPEPSCDVGLFLPLYSLQTTRSWGTADLTDLSALLDWSAARGARFLGTLPLLATFLGGGRAPVAPGPYSPVSRLFWNELYLDVERAPGLERAPEAQALLSSRALREELEALRGGRRVRYGEAMAVKRRVLESVARAVAPLSDPVDGPLAEWAERRLDARAYARFRAAMERLGPPWRIWDEAGRDGPGEDPRDEAAYRYHLYVQWVLEQQVEAVCRDPHGDADAPGARGTLAASPGRAPPEPTRTDRVLYLDLPLGSHPEGFDTWRFRGDFAHGLSAGAPPDPLQQAGQSWGFPPLHPERARGGGHAYFRRSLAHLMRASGMIRLDHVMSLHRLYCIPEEHGPLDGAYVRYPAEELYAALCIESQRWRCEVVGEDLGTVPDEVRQTMTDHGLRRMYVLPFELEAAEGPTPPPPLSVASLGTHDLPPFAAYATGADIERRAADGLIEPADAAREREERARWTRAVAALTGSKRVGPTEDLAKRALRLLADSPARHLLINAEDLWGETESQNQPGTVTDANWTLRARHPLEDWTDVPGLEETLASLVEARRAAGPPKAAPPTENPSRPDEARRSVTRRGAPQ